MGTGKGTSFNQVIAVINKALGTAQPTEYFDNPYGFYQDATCADTERGEKILGWKAGHTPEEGISDYVGWLRARESLPTRA